MLFEQLLLFRPHRNSERRVSPFAAHKQGSVVAVTQGPTLLIPKLSHPDTVLIQLRPSLILTNDFLTI